MTIVEIDDSQLAVHIQGWHRVFALKRTITVPLAHVIGAKANPSAINTPRGFRAPGTRLPGVITAGTFRRRGSKEFWDASRDPTKTLVIELQDDQYSRLVIDVEEPAATAAQIETALRRRLQPNA